jgi:hypothetical protein
MKQRTPQCIRVATRALLNLSEMKRDFGKMAAYTESYRDMGNLLNRIQKKGLPPQMIWCWNSLNILAKKYERKARYAENAGSRRLGK